ncbi:MAG TPA: Maf family protein [Gammaproteobacteria bacterium]|nr:Maf family protein [Gammaproteobacteria bacterium]
MQQQVSLILASTSPYRRELLDRLGLPFETIAPGVDETRQPDESPLALVQRLARAKAQAVAQQRNEGLVIGSDQLAVRENDILGKPGNKANARQQLRQASGKTVTFLTAVCVINAATGEHREHVDTTIVSFRILSNAEIDDYLNREKPFNCAGSFKSEGLGITLFEKIENQDPTALMGLPLIAVARMLREMRRR